MKNNSSTLFKVTGILAIIFGSLFCLGFILIFPLLFGIPLIIGGTQYLKFAEYSNNEVMAHSTAIILWTVVFFLGGMVLGVLSLVAYLGISNSNQVYTNGTTEVTGEIKPDDTNLANDKISKIERLNKLKEQGLISQEEYNNLKNDILNK